MDDIFDGTQQGQPLHSISPERVNRSLHDLNGSPGKRARDSAVSQMAAKFDTLAFQGKALERKANDAALKRAMLGREEAEGEMRRYRDEARQLRKQVDELSARCSRYEERYNGITVCITLRALEAAFTDSSRTNMHVPKKRINTLRSSGTISYGARAKKLSSHPR